LPRLLPPTPQGTAPLKRRPTDGPDTDVRGVRLSASAPVSTDGATARPSRSAQREGWQPDLADRELAILETLRDRGASFFGPLHDAVGGGYPAETVDALWTLVWRGLVTNDTFHALRAFTRAHAPRRRSKAVRRPDVASFRSRRPAPPSAEG